MAPHGGGMMRRGPGGHLGGGPSGMRGGGRLTSRFRSDGRRGGILTSRFNTGGGRRDMMPLRTRRFAPVGRRDGVSGGRITKRTLDTTGVSKKALIKRALAAAKEIDDDDDDQTTENEGEDEEEEEEDADVDDDKDTMVADGEDSKHEDSEEEEEEELEGHGGGGEKDTSEKADKSQDGGEGEEGGEAEKDTSAATAEKAEKSEEGGEGEGEGADEKKDANSTPKKVAKKVVKAKASPGSDDGGEKKKKDTRITTKYRTSSYIKLSCCHCGTKCIHFKEYQNHLFRGLHKNAMRRLAGKTRDKLMEMRQKQRVAQKEEDEKVDADSEQKSSYCPLCQLNFRQPKAVHQKSDGHKEMKRFLMPYCATCKIGFKSPMAYEAHRCSLEHLKFKARVERYAAKEDEDAGTEIDLENFTTVDEVGNVDEPIDTGKENASTPKKDGSAGRPGTDDDEDESDDVDDDTVIIGAEHVKKVEVQYCDLCNMYLPRRDDPEKMLRAHCKNRAHLRLYIRQREDKKLRMRAERIHKKKLTDAKAKKAAKKGDKDTSVASEADSSEKADSAAAGAAKSDKKSDDADKKEETTNEDQLWEVVDNDLGDLLREVSNPTEDAEEEEDEEKTSSERYDKFKHTEKNGVEPATSSTSVHEDDDVVEVSATSTATAASTSPEKKAPAAVKKATNGDAANGGGAAADKEVKADA